MPRTINSLPPELLYRCIDLMRPSADEPEHLRARHIIKQLVPLTLVARSWSDYAQKSLFEYVMLIGPRDVQKFTESPAAQRGKWGTKCLIIGPDPSRAHGKLDQAENEFMQWIIKAIGLCKGLHELRLEPRIVVHDDALLHPSLADLKVLTIECCVHPHLRGRDVRPPFQLDTLTLRRPRAPNEEFAIAHGIFVDYRLTLAMNDSLRTLNARLSDLAPPKERGARHLDKDQPIPLMLVTHTLSTLYFPDTDGNQQRELDWFEFLWHCDLLTTLAIDLDQISSVFCRLPLRIEKIILWNLWSIGLLLEMLQNNDRCLQLLRVLDLRQEWSIARTKRSQDWPKLVRYCEERDIGILVRPEDRSGLLTW